MDSPAVAAIGPLAGPARGWGWPVGIGALLLAGAGAGWYTIRRRTAPKAERPPLFTVPANVTPVSSLALLRKILAQNGAVLPTAEQAELDRTIGELERRYFAPGDGRAANGNGELRIVVERWVRRVNA